jgi:hypothetical protein
MEIGRSGSDETRIESNVALGKGKNRSSFSFDLFRDVERFEKYSQCELINH